MFLLMSRLLIFLIFEWKADLVEGAGGGVADVEVLLVRAVDLLRGQYGPRVPSI